MLRRGCDDGERLSWGTRRCRSPSRRGHIPPGGAPPSDARAFPSGAAAAARPPAGISESGAATGRGGVCSSPHRRRRTDSSATVLATAAAAAQRMNRLLLPELSESIAAPCMTNDQAARRAMAKFSTSAHRPQKGIRSRELAGCA